MYNTHLRQTGRTTRMLLDAVEASKSGKEVYVLISNHDFLQKIFVLANEVGIKDYIKNSSIKIRVISSNHNDDWDWDSYRLLGVGDETAVFVDHIVIERKYEKILSELHKYDVV